VLYRRQSWPQFCSFSGLSGDWYNGMWQLTGKNSSVWTNASCWCAIQDITTAMFYFSFHFIRLSKNDFIMQLQVHKLFHKKWSSSGPRPRSLASRAVSHFCTNNGKNSGNVIMEKWSRRLLLVCVGLVPSLRASEALHPPSSHWDPLKVKH